MRSFVLILALAAFIPLAASQATGTRWAVLVAGSSGYDNYRHQSDVYHAYQIVKSHGYPDSNIVVMHYDDIAEDRRNPTKGTVINKPNGANVYVNVPKDYTKRDVTPDNFLAVLSGNANGVSGGSGRVIKSGPNDHVFVYFADHGAPGLVAFPHSTLSAKKFMDTLTSMHANNQYKEMVIYIEACESGSMFDGLLPTNMSIFATTAANGDESSYAAYYSQQYRTYLGDVYSVNWMENTDASDVTKETLESQYTIVQKETNTSHVQQFGDMSISKQMLAEFQSFSDASSAKPLSPSNRDMPMEVMDSRDVRLAILKHIAEDCHMYADCDPQDAARAVKEEMADREEWDRKIKTIVMQAVGDAQTAYKVLGMRHKPRDFTCLEAGVEVLQKGCGQLSDYALKHVRQVVNMCEHGVPVDAISQAIQAVCLE